MIQNHKIAKIDIFIQISCKIIPYILLICLMTILTLSCSNSPTGTGNGDGGDNGGGDDGQPTVASVEIEPSFATVEPGDTFQFSATVSGTNNPSQTVLWSVEGGVEATTISEESGLLNLASEETAVQVIIRAVSTADATKYGTATVRVGSAEIWEVHNTSTWEEARTGIISSSNKSHIINVSGDVSIPPITTILPPTYTFGSVRDLFVHIRGNGSLSPSTTGNYLFHINSEQTIIIEDIIINGNNNIWLINIYGGSLELRGNAKITDGNGGGIKAYGGAIIHMYDNSIISNNTSASSGAGVGLNSGSSLVMHNNSSIINNQIGIYGTGDGAGVSVGSSSSFIMKDNSRVSGNSLTAGTTARGGGVYVVEGASFVMENGEISNNSVRTLSSSVGGIGPGARGGGVAVETSLFNSGTFVMYNGVITNNSLESPQFAYGGGVWGTITMYDGVISNNTVTAGGTTSHTYTDAALGGGVYGNVIMHGGTISGNTLIAISNSLNPNARGLGGGVYVPWSVNMQFEKTNGTIYGYDTSVNRNHALGGKGHAVYLVESGTDDLWRNQTAGPSDNSTSPNFWLNEDD